MHNGAKTIERTHSQRYNFKVDSVRFSTVLGRRNKTLAENLENFRGNIFCYSVKSKDAALYYYKQAPRVIKMYAVCSLPRKSAAALTASADSLFLPPDRMVVIFINMIEYEFVSCRGRWIPPPNRRTESL